MPRSGNTKARGYSGKHRAERVRLAGLQAAGVTLTCWRCRGPIPPPPPGHRCRPGCRSASCLDLGHDDVDRSIVRGPEHRHRTVTCIGNRAAGATNGNRRRGRRRSVVRTAGRPTLVVDDW